MGRKLGRAGSCPLPPLFHLLVLPCTLYPWVMTPACREGRVGLSFLFFLQLTERMVLGTLFI